MGNWSSCSKNVGRFDGESEDYSDPRTIPPNLHFSTTPIAHALMLLQWPIVSSDWEIHSRREWYYAF